jgi:hypothetical protein
MSIRPSLSGDRLHDLDRTGGAPAFVSMHGIHDAHESTTAPVRLLSPQRVVTFDFFRYWFWSSRG